ncbi:MAG: hypothetical protein ACRDP9_04010, partial [Kribbellaceae bacterium]
SAIAPREVSATSLRSATVIELSNAWFMAPSRAASMRRGPLQTILPQTPRRRPLIRIVEQ